MEEIKNTVPQEEVKPAVAEQEEKQQEQAKQEEVQEVLPQQGTISKLIQDLHAALEGALSVIAQYQQKLREVKESQEQVESRTHILNTLKDSLNEREFACKRVEDIVDLHKKALAMEKDYSEKLLGLQEAINHHNRDKESWKRQQEEERAEARKETMYAQNLKKNVEQEVTRRVRDNLVRMGFIKEDQALPPEPQPVVVVAAAVEVLELKEPESTVTQP